MKIKEHIFTIIIGVLCVVLVITTLVVGSEFIEDMENHTYTENDFLYCIRSEDYYRMTEYMYINEINGAKVTEGMEECYAVAGYFEAASMYKAYAAVGKNAEAEEKEQVMEAQKEKMGELSYVAENIDDYLELKTE